MIGDDVTIGHGAVLESCRIGDGALIGMNAVVLQRAIVGAQALIGAGAVVQNGMDVPARHLAVGAPARVKKEIAGESLRWIATGAAHYVELSRRYLSSRLGEVSAAGAGAAAPTVRTDETTDERKSERGRGRGAGDAQ